MKNVVIRNIQGLYWTGRKWDILANAKRFTREVAVMKLGANSLGHTLESMTLQR